MTYDVSKIFPRFCLHIIFFPHHFPMDFMIVPMEISTSFSHETSIFRWVFPHLFDSKSQEPHRNNFRPCKVCLCGKSQVEMAEIFHGKIPGKTMGKRWENGDLYGKLTVCDGKSPFLMGKSTTVFFVEWILFTQKAIFYRSRDVMQSHASHEQPTFFL